MAHLHSVYDTDSHFSIDKITRAIKNESSKKVTVMQFDHNSERFTFDLPRYIEGHDMSVCNLSEVHYQNGSTKGVYVIDDLQISPADNDVVICSWLISRNATQNAAALDFRLTFSCVSEEGKNEYEWNTGVHKGISVQGGIRNSEVIEEEYSDAIGYLNEKMNTAVLCVEQHLTEEQKAQARANIGAQPVGAYLTEVPEGYAKNEDIEKVDRKVDTLREVVSTFHSNIVEEAKGETIVLDDASDLELAGLKVFGKTVVLNQLAKFSGVNKTVSGIAMKSNTDGSLSMSGTITAADNTYCYGYKTLIDGHVYLFCAYCDDAEAADNISMHYGTQYYRDILNKPYVLTIDGTRPTNIVGAIYLKTPGATIDYTIRILQIDLTQMFGNEIANTIKTAEEAYALGVPRGHFPYNPGELVSVGDGGSVGVTVAGLNIWDEEWYNASLNTENGTFVEGSDRNVSSKNYIPVNSNTEYYFSLRPYVVCYDGNKKFIETIRPDTDRVLITPENCRFIRFQTILSSYGAVYKNDIIISIGNVEVPYAPYKETQSLTIQKPTDAPVFLPGIPTRNEQWMTCDYVDFAAGKYVQRIGKLVLNGDEKTWIATKDSLYSYGLMSDARKFNSSAVFALCNAIANSNSHGQLTTDIITRVNIDSGVEFRNVIANFGLTEVSSDAFNAYLAENPIEFLYELENPIIHDLSDEEMAQYATLHTNYHNTTIINDGGADMEVKYVADTKLYIDKKFAELSMALLNQ